MQTFKEKIGSKKEWVLKIQTGSTLKMTKRKRGNSDFVKVKEKVGKKAKKLNETNTNFVTKSIVMPKQSTFDEKGGAVNQRNLRFIDLIPQLKHYNPSIRKDAVLGLKDFFIRNPESLLPKLSQTLDAILPMLIDVEKQVRSSLKVLIQYIISKVQSTQYQPYMKLTVVYICHAMTSMHTNVRKDITSIIKLFINFYPNLITEHSEMIIKNMSSLLKSSSDDIITRTKHMNKNKNKELDVDIELIECLQLFLNILCPKTTSQVLVHKETNKLDFQTIGISGLMVLSQFSDSIVFKPTVHYEISKTSISKDSLQNAFVVIWKGLSDIWLEKIIEISSTTIPQSILIKLITQIMECKFNISNYFIINEEFDPLIDINNYIKLYSSQYMSQYPLHLVDNTILNKNELNKLVINHNLLFSLYLFNLDTIYHRNNNKNKNKPIHADLYTNIISYLNELLNLIDYRQYDIDNDSCNYLLYLFTKCTNQMNENEEISQLLEKFVKNITRCPYKNSNKILLYQFLLQIFDRQIIIGNDEYCIDKSLIKQSLYLVPELLSHFEYCDSNKDDVNILLHNWNHLIVKMDENELTDVIKCLVVFFIIQTEEKEEEKDKSIQPLINQYDIDTQRLLLSLFYYLPFNTEFRNTLVNYLKSEFNHLDKSLLIFLSNILSKKDENEVVGEIQTIISK